MYDLRRASGVQKAAEATDGVVDERPLQNTTPALSALGTFWTVAKMSECHYPIPVGACERHKKIPELFRTVLCGTQHFFLRFILASKREAASENRKETRFILIATMKVSISLGHQVVVGEYPYPVYSLIINCFTPDIHSPISSVCDPRVRRST